MGKGNLKLGHTKLRNCPICGRIYVETGGKICPSCWEKEEEKIADVLRYVREHPNTTLEEISEATGMHPLAFRKMYRDGRLSGMEGFQIHHLCRCSRCGKPIPAGKLCKNCAAFFERSVNKAQERFEKNHPDVAAERRKKEEEKREWVAKLSHAFKRGQKARIQPEEEIAQLEQFEKLCQNLLRRTEEAMRARKRKP